MLNTQKDLIFHVTTKFSIKQGETRTNSVPIPHPLNWQAIFVAYIYHYHGNVHLHQYTY